MSDLIKVTVYQYSRAEYGVSLSTVVSDTLYMCMHVL